MASLEGGSSGSYDGDQGTSPKLISELSIQKDASKKLWFLLVLWEVIQTGIGLITEDQGMVQPYDPIDWPNPACRRFCLPKEN